MLDPREPRPEMGSVEVDDMTAETDIAALCRQALEEESGWRSMGLDGRRAAYDRFQRLIREIASLTGRTYEEVMNDAVEEWLTVHFCAIPSQSESSGDWRVGAEVDAQA